MPYWSTTASGSEAGPILQVPDDVLAGRDLARNELVQRLVAASAPHRSARSRSRMIGSKSGCSASLDGGSDHLAHAAVGRTRRGGSGSPGTAGRAGRPTGAAARRRSSPGRDCRSCGCRAGSSGCRPVHPLRGERLHEDHQVVPEVRAFGRPAQHQLGAGRQPVQRVLRPGPPGDVDATGGRVSSCRRRAASCTSGMPNRASCSAGPTPDSISSVRRADGARAEDDLLAVHREPLAAALDLDADRPLALEQQAADVAVGPDRSGSAGDGRGQVARAPCSSGCRPGCWRGSGPMPVACGMVVVRHVREAGVPAGVVEGVLVRQPLSGLGRGR